ncbi:membrane protein [Streptomyces spectabilis]|uniref:DUF2637 domain-containing protein n=2 Tax=Streptomyces spectabilis TaxID=68270 RepID=A0A5P2XEM1_STRST|nr:DUF2637 domain-containing protein [Streptomyces spectabilis]GGV26340.1 membrane protein [Streptomyces spectabilis]
MAAMQLTRMHRILIGVVVFGALVIAGIGFAGSYAAVRELAEKKGFGSFSVVFPIGIDAGICVLLALDLLLTWIRIPFPLLRQTAWLLTAATIAFNGAAAWPDPLGVGMHAVIPVLFVVAVEAARHAVGRIADITADKHMEGVRMTRWLLSPLPTFLLWRRMKLWELRSYDQVIKLEQERLVYQARLRSRFGRRWRSKAPVESLMPLRLARYGVPLAETAPAGLAAAGIEPAVLPPVTAVPVAERPAQQPELAPAPASAPAAAPAAAPPQVHAEPEPERPVELQKPSPPQPPGRPEGVEGPEGPDGQWAPGQHGSPWFAAPQPQRPQGEAPLPYDPEGPYEEWYEEQDQEAYETFEGARPYARPAEPDAAEFRVPSGPGRTRPLANGTANGQLIPNPRAEQAPDDEPEPLPEPAEGAPGLPDDMTREEAYFSAFRKYVSEMGDYPNARQFSLYLMDLYGVTGQAGGPLTESTLRPYLRGFRDRYQQDLDAEEHIA